MRMYDSNPGNEQPFRCLSIDGGGMRGYYSASYLAELISLGDRRYHSDIRDFGAQFQLIAGTSTGAILGGGLLSGVPVDQIVSLYASNGERIFPVPMPSGILRLLWHMASRSKFNRRGDAALRDALNEALGDLTLGELYEKRGIAFAVPAVNLTTHRGWVFKTPHNTDTNYRDSGYTLVDVCMASSAAPIYRSLASLKQNGKSSARDLFVDGGLWANNPVMVALIEALRFARPGQPIEIFCLGNSPATPGTAANADNPHWGFLEWRFGSRALELSLDAQTQVYDDMARMFCQYSGRRITIIRFPQRTPSAVQGAILNLDSSGKNSLDLMRHLAAGAADDTNQMLDDADGPGRCIRELLTSRNHGVTQASNYYGERNV